MHELKINGTVRSCFGLVRGGRGLVLPDGILLMEPVCTHNGVTEFEWPEILPTEIRQRDFYPWRRKPWNRIDFFRMRSLFRDHLRAKLAELDERQAAVHATTLAEFLQDYGTGEAGTEHERFQRWKSAELEAIAQLRKPYDGGFDLDKKHYEYTLRDFVSEFGDQYREAQWFAEKDAGDARALGDAVLGLNLGLRAHGCGPAGRDGWDFRCSLIDTIRLEAAYDDTVIFLRRLKPAPHDSESISLLGFYRAGGAVAVETADVSPRGGSPEHHRTPHPGAVPDPREPADAQNQPLQPAASVLAVDGAITETGAAEAMGGCAFAGFRETEDLLSPKVEAVREKLDLVNGKLDAVSGKLDGLSTAVEGATVAVADAGRLAGEAKAAANTTTEAVTAKLIPQYESLERVKEAELRRAALAVLQGTPLPEPNREIIELYYGRNFSYDRILRELRRQGRGRSKRYVGEVIRGFNGFLKAKGLRAKEKVSGPPLPPDHGFGEEEQPVPLAEDSPTDIAEAQDETAEVVSTTVAAWERADRAGKEQLEAFYPWLRGELECAGHQPVSKPK